MNKTALKNFAIAARLELLQRVADRAALYGIDESASKSRSIAPSNVFHKVGGAVLTAQESTQRSALVQRVYRAGFRQTMEEVAYTWFNRFIALKYMQQHNLLPVGMHVLPDAPGQQPQMLRQAQEVSLSGADMGQVLAMLDANQTDALYKYLLIALCNELSVPLPRMFETISDYTELLFPDGLLKADSVLGQMAELENDCWDEIQVIGWLYQYYNTELKDETFELLKKNVKISKERIGAATQLFTPEWIVRYMVENSVGRLWLEGHPNATLRAKWRYYMDEAPQEPPVAARLAELRKPCAAMQPEQLTVLDPCMGSGHILVYAFDVLMDIYRSVGYTDRDAAQSIVAHNLYGLDIDDRAAQLAYFAVMMKACEYDRRFLRRGVQPNVCPIAESMELDAHQLSAFGAEQPLAQRLLNTFVNAKEYGSILHVDMTAEELRRLRTRLTALQQAAETNLIGLADSETIATIEPLLLQAENLTRKYDAVVTNPPYMGSSGMNDRLARFVKDNYPDSKSDLFAVFMERGLEWVKENGFTSMVTMQSWMFLSSFEKMRNKIIKEKTITTLMHMENMVMGIAFGTAVTVLRNTTITHYKGTYNHIKYEDIVNDVPIEFPIAGNRFAQISTENFTKIPGMPVAYWVSDKLYTALERGLALDSIAMPRQGLATGDNDFYLRTWHEVNYEDIGMGFSCTKSFHEAAYKYAPYNKGGAYRKWYGNRTLIIRFDLKHFEQLLQVGNHLPSRHLYFRKGINWSALTNGQFSGRYCEFGFVFDTKGSSCFFETTEQMLYIQALLNSNVSSKMLEILSPTLDFNCGSIGRIKVIWNDEPLPLICSKCTNCIDEAKNDWDSFETSWDFKKHPLV